MNSLLQHEFEITGEKDGKPGRWKLRAGSIGEAKLAATKKGVRVTSVIAIGHTAPPAELAPPPDSSKVRMIGTGADARPEDFYDRLWAGMKRSAGALFRGSKRTAIATGKASVIAAKVTSQAATVLATPPQYAPTHVCMSCGCACSPVAARDNQGCGCLLTFLFLVPGLLWFAFSPKRLRCTSCRAENVIPINSPVAQTFLQTKSRPARPLQ